MELEKIVVVSPAFDKRSDDPKHNYGIGACGITFILRGESGSVQFKIGTDWYTENVQREGKVFESPFFSLKPQGWDVGYHSPKPMYENQTQMADKCEYSPGGVCYYDGSGLRAEEWAKKFITGGTEWLWPELEKEYKHRFEV